MVFNVYPNIGVNNIIVDACRLGLKDVIISILDHDWINLDYCDGELLMMANIIMLETGAITFFYFKV